MPRYFPQAFRSPFLKMVNDNNGVFEVFWNLFTFPHSQDETEQAALQRKATMLNQSLWDVVKTRELSWGYSVHYFLKLHKRWWLPHPGLEGKTSNQKFLASTPSWRSLLVSSFS